MRRFLLHTLPDGFHRIRHYGFLANGHRAARIELCRRLLPDKPQAAATGAEGDSAEAMSMPALRRADDHPQRLVLRASAQAALLER